MTEARDGGRGVHWHGIGGWRALVLGLLWRRRAHPHPAHDTLALELMDPFLG